MIKNLLLRLEKDKRFFIVVCVVVIIISLFIIQVPKDEQQLSTPLKNLEPTDTPTITPTLIPGMDYVVGQVSVKFKSTISQQVINEKLKQYKARIINTIPQIQVTVLEVPKGQEQEIVKKLQQDGIVEYAELDYIYEDDAFTPNDPEFSKQWGLPKIQAPEAWDITKGQGVIIAVIDSGGADNTHPDLAAKIIKGTGNDAHGTHVAGIMAAITNNGTGVAGTCPECKLIIENPGGSYSASSVAGAILDAANSGAKVANMSFGGISSQTVGDAINSAWNKGMICVATAGNNNVTTKRYPAAFPHVVSVASTDKNDNKSSFSSYGNWVTIAAPGSSIYSTVAGGGYKSMSGTSMSAPMVAGVIGLIWSTSYGTSPDAVVKRLCDTADKISGTGNQWQCGRINAFKAVKDSTGEAPASPVQQTTASAPINNMGGDVPSPVCLGSCPTPVPASAESTHTQPSDIPQPSLKGNTGNTEFISLFEFILNFMKRFLR